MIWALIKPSPIITTADRPIGARRIQRQGTEARRGGRQGREWRKEREGRDRGDEGRRKKS